MIAAQNAPPIANPELRGLLSVTRRLPHVRGAGVLANGVKSFYLRRPREMVVADVAGFQMCLDPAECVDGSLLFSPQLYDAYELHFLSTRLRQGDVFIDAGANIGLYSLVASKAVGETGVVVAIEADPCNHAKLCHNLELNGIGNVKAVNLGLSDKAETLRLGINDRGNRGGNSFLADNPNGVSVPCQSLHALLSETGVTRVRGMKMDIEGFEYRVLNAFFATADRTMHPEFVIIEVNPTLRDKSGGSALTLLTTNGYRVTWSSKLNTILSKVT